MRCIIHSFGKIFQLSWVGIDQRFVLAGKVSVYTMQSPKTEKAKMPKKSLPYIFCGKWSAKTLPVCVHHLKCFCLECRRRRCCCCSSSSSSSSSSSAACVFIVLRVTSTFLFSELAAPSDTVADALRNYRLFH